MIIGVNHEHFRKTNPSRQRRRLTRECGWWIRAHVHRIRTEAKNADRTSRLSNANRVITTNIEVDVPSLTVVPPIKPREDPLFDPNSPGYSPVFSDDVWCISAEMWKNLKIDTCEKANYKLEDCVKMSKGDPRNRLYYEIPKQKRVENRVGKHWVYFFIPLETFEDSIELID